MMLVSRLVFLLSALSVFAAHSQPCKIKESITAPPRGWRKHSDPHPDATITLRIGLPQANYDKLEKHLIESSDPAHERYGLHLSKEEVEALVAPHDESVTLVDEWLASHGLGEEDLHRSAAKDWVTLTMKVSQAEEMLKAKYYVWEHATSGDYIVRTLNYSLPAHLHDHIEVLQPTTLFAQWKGMRNTLFFEDNQQLESQLAHAKTLPPIINAATGVTVDPACNVSITVSCLKQLYNAVDYKAQAPKKNSIAITSYLEENANFADLQTFYADQVPEAVGTNFTVISVAGGLNDQDPANAGFEANLDTQFAFGLAFPAPATAYTTAGRPPFIPDATTPENTNEPYLDWLDFVLHQKNVPHVISTSYGEPEQTIPENYLRRACQGFAQLGARGVSLTFSSGDGGVGDGDPDPATQQCLTNDGKNTTHFLSIFPSTCPFVTSIGGTNNVPEVAVFFSGGGFSWKFPRPWYQEKVIPKFLKSLPAGLYKGLYNPAGRAIPDVAAQGRRFRIFVGGRIVSIGGTSASAPTFAAIVALLNDARLAKGLPTLGFLNPLLYSDAVSKTFNDITIGNNPGCGTPGFNATTGWDPVTGFGTPNFGKLLKLVT